MIGGKRCPGYCLKPRGPGALPGPAHALRQEPAVEFHTVRDSLLPNGVVLFRCPSGQLAL
eukprot:6890047-Lingulodinium_polyedra.AAC.1